MNIEIKIIKWKNFLSYGDEYTTINIENGMDLSIGLNGTGKSTMVDVLFFNLFGKPFRKIKTGSLINRIIKKRLETEVIFNIDDLSYKVLRGQKPAKFEIYKKEGQSWELIEQRAATKDYQKFLEEEILCINETIFRQLVAISSNLPSSKPFMELSQSEKESLFQVLTDTSIFGHLKTAIKVRTSDKKQELKELEYKRDILKSSIDSEKLMIEQAEKQNDDFKAHHEENLKVTKENIANTTETIQKYKDALEKLKVLKVEYDELQADISNLTINLDKKRSENARKIQKIQEKNMKKYQELISECTISENDILYLQTKETQIQEIKQKNQTLASEKMDLDNKVKIIEAAEKNSIVCVSCKTTNYLTEICDNEVHKKEEYLSLIKDIKTKINLNTSLVKKLEIALKEYKTTVQESIQTNKNSIDAKKELLDKDIFEQTKVLRETLVPLEKEIQVIKTNADKLKEKLLNGKRVKETLTEQENNLAYYKNKLLELQSIKAIIINYDSYKEKQALMEDLLINLKKSLKIKDDLLYLDTIIDGNNLKGAVIKKQIPFLNKGINHFLELFSLLEYSFIIDENFKERLINRNDDSEFNSLSNGQKSRISFSIMFSFLKLIEERNGVKTNLLVLDEILDSSVDASGREELLGILKSEFSNTKNIIIISHNPEIKEKVELFDRLIHIDIDKYSKLTVEEL